jgi:hypothetical protein
MARVSEREKALLDLRQRVPEGSTVCTLIRHESSSEGTAVVDLFVATGTELRRIVRPAAKLLGVPYTQELRGITVPSGPDAGRDLVARLAEALYQDQGALKHRALAAPG